MSLKKCNILVVDDNRGVRTALELLLTPRARKVTTLSDPSKIAEQLEREPADILLLDMNFRSATNDGNEGLFWLRELQRRRPQLPVVLMTAFADIELAVAGIKEGAKDFIVKPWDNERLVATIERIVDRKATPAMPGSDMDWGMSDKMRELHEMVVKIAPTDANILITGENGTGKDMLAREIHRLSSRRDAEFLSVDLGSLAPSLFESELFGHKKGAFTGAVADSKGKFVEASGGTLLLDEIGNIQPEQQMKLLTVLQSRKVTPVGATRSVDVDVRIISATNADIESMVAAGQFREDLMYRLNTIRLHVPALRERPDDIPALAAKFLSEYALRYNKPVTALSPAALEMLKEYPWPGNVRQLRHAVEQAVILAETETLQPNDFRLPRPAPANAMAEAQTLEQMERQMIQKAIEDCGGNMSQAAMRLGITRQTLYNKMKRYGL